MNVIRIAALAIIVCAGTAASAAPSFDCAKAASVMEKAVCSDPKLSEMDAKLAASYRSALSRLSPEAQSKVRDSQRQWLKYAGTVCGRVNLPKDDSRAQPPAACLIDEYQGRQKHFDTSVTAKDGKTFYYLHVFKAGRSPETDDTSGYKSGFVILDISYPQLDAPKTPSEIRMNALLADAPSKTEKDFKPANSEDTTLRVELSAVRPALISFDGVSGSYGHGAAHGQYAPYSMHWLVREGRQLKALDIFSAQTKWQDFLRNRCFDGIKHFDFIKAASELQETPVSPDAWTLDKKGLTVTFAPYEVASYADGTPQVTISWDKLKPYLAPTAPAILEGIR